MALLVASGCALLLAGGASSAALRAAQPTIWFAPLPADPGMQPRGSTDYMQLFRRDARWPRAAKRVRVVKLYDTWITSFATRGQLARIVSDLRRRRMALAVEVLPLVATQCGNGVEGFAEPGHVARLARALKAAGGRISYVAFDEPFAFGHLYDGPNACRWSAEQVARAVGTYVRKLRRWYPGVVAGDIEPLWAGTDPGELEGWLETYARVTGKHLPFFDLDMDFSRADWLEATTRLQSFARSHGVRFGFIYIGDGSTDRRWSQTAENRFVAYELKSGLRPDRVIFQSWLDHPDRVLPETKPWTFTWLLDRYVRPRPRLRLVLAGDTASATLADGGGSPLSGKRVSVTATPLDGSGLYAEYGISGTVPRGAVQAEVGLRVNLECGCSGPADVTLYEAAYREDGGPNRVQNPRFDQGLQGWGAWGDASIGLEPSDRGGFAVHVTAAAGRQAGLNSSDFATSGGRPFRLTFAARIAPHSTGSGYFDVMFMRAGGVEFSRVQVPLAAATVPLGSALTDRAGRVEQPLATLGGGAFLVEASFRGDSRWFPGYASSRVVLP